jgi:hypothetical protein
VDALTVDGGSIDEMSIGGDIRANGDGSRPTRVENGGRARFNEKQALPA